MNVGCETKALRLGQLVNHALPTPTTAKEKRRRPEVETDTRISRDRSMRNGSTSSGINKATLYVGGLIHNVKKEILKREFSKRGFNLSKVSLAQKQPGVAFVTLEQRKAVEKAIREMNGQVVCGAYIRVGKPGELASEMATGDYCGVCFESVITMEELLKCTGSCRRRFHYRCLNIDRINFKKMSRVSKGRWMCNRCRNMKPAALQKEQLEDGNSQVEHDVDQPSATMCQIQYEDVCQPAATVCQVQYDGDVDQAAVTLCQVKYDDVDKPETAMGHLHGSDVLVQELIKKEMKVAMYFVSDKLDEVLRELSVIRSKVFDQPECILPTMDTDVPWNLR